MRAILAYIGSAAGLPAAGIAEGMLRATAVLKPDRSAIWHRDPAALGVLAYDQLPEDRADQQPRHGAESAVVLVVDAVLTNRSELIAALGWPESATALSDSALVLAAYERWDARCSDRLAGEFAFIAWHPRERKLFCAVDHLGHRPLYFHRLGGNLAVASTLRGIFASPHASRHLDPQGLAARLASLPPVTPDATLYRDVKILPAGHSLTFDAGGLTIARHWRPDASRVLSFRTEADGVEAFRHELERAVADSLSRTSRQVAILVSGGLDSSALTAVAGRLLQRQGRRLQAIHLVPEGTVGPVDSPSRELDESRFARALRAHLPHVDFHFLPNRSTVLPPAEWDSFFDVHQVPFVGFPGRSDPAFSDLLTRLDVGLLLDGGGGNYLVSLESLASGYLSHLFFSGSWRRWIHECRQRRVFYGDDGRSLLRETVLRPAFRSLRGWPIPSRHPVHLLTADRLAETGVIARLRNYQRAVERPDTDFRRQLQHLLVELAPTPGAGIRESVIGAAVPVRQHASPMYDRRLNELCLAMPFALQVRDGVDRRLLREATRGLLPEAIRLRTTRGFPQPAFLRRMEPWRSELGGELLQACHQPAVAEWLDSNQLTDIGRHAATVAPRRLLEATVLTRFLLWLDRR